MSNANSQSNKGGQTCEGCQPDKHGMKRNPTTNMQRALQWLRDHGFMGPDEDFVQWCDEGATYNTRDTIRTELNSDRSNQRPS